MAAEKPTSITLPPPLHTGRRLSPSPMGMRQRPLGRSSTFAEGNAPLSPRRNSFLSETLSETRRSIRSSTDDILLPRPKGDGDMHDADDDDNSHWQSLPLGLALLPAVGGLFFQNGSAVITDVTLLGLAAIFMNWALRSPWDWYRAAQSPLLADPPTPTISTPIEEVDESLESPSPQDANPLSSDTKSASPPVVPPAHGARADNASAVRELRTYELIALLSCFVFPLLAAWLLHGIRSQLTRPSEGLVSNYNLTIFILVAEIRPISHLIKMVQHRTLFLQRRVNADVLLDSRRGDRQQLRDVAHRLEELEAHVANRIAGAGADAKAHEGERADEALAAKASALATSDVKKTVQPELDALNRAMRRYEKRSTISSVQIETRLQDLETRLNDVVSLAAAVQRNADRKPNNYIVILSNWVCAAVVLPVQYMTYILGLPGKVVNATMAVPQRYMFKKTKTTSPATKEPRSSRKGTSTRPGDREKRLKSST